MHQVSSGFSSNRKQCFHQFFRAWKPWWNLTLVFEIVLQTYTAVVDCRIYNNEREKENEWNYSTYVIFFFLSKPWSLLNQSFPKLSRYAKPLLILDDVANRHLLLRSKMKTKNKKKRNIIKHVWGFFHSYLRKQDAHELWRENSVIFLPYGACVLFHHIKVPLTLFLS